MNISVIYSWDLGQEINNMLLIFKEAPFWYKTLWADKPFGPQELYTKPFQQQQLIRSA